MKAATIPVTLIVLGYLTLGISSASAVSINYNGTPASLNLQSDGVSPMSGAFVFVLGAFRDFTPDSGNVTQWRSKWEPLAMTAYNPVTRFFAGTANLTSNAAPFGTMSRAYIWGFRSGGGCNEWILISDPSWTWPASTDLGFPVTFNVAAASDCIVGSINSSGVEMQSAAIDPAALPPLISGEDWRDLYFSDADQQSGQSGDWLTDADSDGLNTLLEYALGGSPLQAEAKNLQPSAAIAFVNSADYLVMTVLRNMSASVQWDVEASADGAAWSVVADPTAVLLDTPGELRIRNQLPVGVAGAPRAFMRPRVALP